MLPLLLFALTYAGLALGRFPGLALDRTGFAVLGAVLFLATGAISLDEAKEAVDAPTLAVLFGMMLLSAQYRLAGLYTAISRRLARSAEPRRLLAGTIVATALLSAVLTNDVVCFALTPLMGAIVLHARLRPLPFFLAIACASNIGSALTPIGNPQNILVAQALNLEFLPFVSACLAPVAASLIALYLLLVRQVVRTAPSPSDAPEPTGDPMPLDRAEAIKAVALTAAAILLFLSPIPPYLTALGIGGVVLTSRRMHTRSFLALVDWNLLALFVSLFVVMRGFELSGDADAVRDFLVARGIDLGSPVANLPVVVVLGNIVSNVPAVMLLLPFIPHDPDTGHGIALASTFAGNAFLVGSIANLIVVEQAQRLGHGFGYREHARIGVPITLVSLACTALAVAYWNLE